MTHDHLLKMNEATAAIFREISKPAIRQRENAVRGLGDVVERITTATGIKAAVEYFNGGPCRGCQQRQQNLNEAFPFGSEK